MLIRGATLFVIVETLNILLLIALFKGKKKLNLINKLFIYLTCIDIYFIYTIYSGDHWLYSTHTNFIPIDIIDISPWCTNNRHFHFLHYFVSSLLVFKASFPTHQYSYSILYSWRWVGTDYFVVCRNNNICCVFIFWNIYRFNTMGNDLHNFFDISFYCYCQHNVICSIIENT